MASKKFTEDSVEWKVFFDVWRIFQEYAEPEDTEEYWNSLLSRTLIEPDKKYDNKQEVARVLYSAIVDILEARWHSLKKYGNTDHAHEFIRVGDNPYRK